MCCRVSPNASPLLSHIQEVRGDQWVKFLASLKWGISEENGRTGMLLKASLKQNKSTLLVLLRPTEVGRDEKYFPVSYRGISLVDVILTLSSCLSNFNMHQVEGREGDGKEGRREEVAWYNLMNFGSCLHP